MSRKRHVKELAEREGLTVVDVKQTGGNHICVRASNTLGWVANFILPLTPGDHRAERNKVAEFRRFAQGRENPVQERRA